MGMAPVKLTLRDSIDEGLPNPLGESLAHTSIVFCSLASFFVIARLCTRMLNSRLATDDFIIILALMVAVGMTIAYNGEAHNGFGLHHTQVDKAHQAKAFEYFYFAQIFYKVATGLTKVSILFFYLRIFTDRNFRLAAWTVMGVVAAYVIATVAATIWQCTPIKKSWEKTLPGSCINIAGVWYGASVMAILTDVAIIILPIKEVLALKLPKAQKVGLIIMFSLGIFVMATTIVRMVKLGPTIVATDATYYQAVANSWAFLEVDIGIICASLPALKAPIMHFSAYIFSTSFGSSVARSGASKGNTSQGTTVRYTMPDQNLPGEVLSKLANTKVVRSRVHETTTDNASDEEVMLQNMGSIKRPSASVEVIAVQ